MNFDQFIIAVVFFSIVYYVAYRRGMNRGVEAGWRGCESHVLAVIKEIRKGGQQ